MYYVYENWRARGHRVVIHESNCGYCNNGRGVSTGTRPDNGKWHGPFTSLDEAIGHSRGLSGDFQYCKVCLRGRSDLPPSIVPALE